MKTLDKWAERLYAETDFGRSVATSVAGIVGLAVHLSFLDRVIAAFSAIIVLPIVRLLASNMHERAVRRSKGRLARQEAERIYDQLSPEEKCVVSAFVDDGGCSLTWGRIDNLGSPSAGMESLVQRKLIWPSMTADGMRETFVLDSAIFDVGQRHSHAQIASGDRS